MVSPEVRVEDVGHLLYALLYFDDAEAERCPDGLEGGLGS